MILYSNTNICLNMIKNYLNLLLKSRILTIME